MVKIDKITTFKRYYKSVIKIQNAPHKPGFLASQEILV